MRSSISCDACRRSKVRCLNTGKPPCQRCLKSGIEGCTLAKPGPATSRARTRQTRQTLRQASRQSTLEPPTAAGSSPPAAERSVEAHLVNLPKNLILKALHLFLNKVPELAFVHIPRFMEDWWNSPHKEEMKTLLATILAFIRDHLVVLNLGWHQDLLSAEQYLSYARANLVNMALEPPRIQVVQGLLILSLYEWGSQGYHRAWMYCGFATRLMQALHSTRKAPHGTDSTATFTGDTVLLAIENRTFWACFVMDCMINSGTYNPRMLTMSEMNALKVGPPLSAVDFSFGPDLSQNSDVHNYELSNRSRVFDVAQAFEVLVSGFDIWVQVMAFIFNDGRRAPGMCVPENCPWAPDSPWSKLRQQLEHWRTSQHSRLHYPENNVSTHMALGYAESFTHINLLYYLSTMMLHREYFPFLPVNEAQPRGPIDPPFLGEEAPVDWWSNSANELFGAASNIATLLHEACECEVPLLTPFAGFCGFSSAFINTYVCHFPAMNFGRSLQSKRLVNWSIDYLETFSRVWKLGDAWLKTIKNASLLYERANRDQIRYGGKSRQDFSVLHQSIHEFRVIDRSAQQLRELEEAEQSCADPNLRLQEIPIPITAPSGDGEEASIERIFADMRGSWDEDGVWSHWWTSQEGHDFNFLPT